MQADVLVVGCGLSGAVIARFLAEERDKKVVVFERRNHIGGNMYDFRDEAGILVHLYGPHTFHTNEKYLFEYMQRFAGWGEYHLTCGAEINGKFTPTPFNFQTIEDFFSPDEARKIKEEIYREYGERPQATVVEMLESKNCTVRNYAQFLFDNDYKLYTAKQWGISPDAIDVSVLKRVPVEFSYRVGYFHDKYQFMPETSYTDFFNKLLAHKNIEVKLETEALDFISLDTEKRGLFYKGEKWDKPLIYTGAIDELLGGKYGKLPYRSLKFDWKTLGMDSYQSAPVVAYPQAEGYTRITEYKKLPGIIGLGKAVELAAATMQERTEKESALRDYLISRIEKEIPYCRLNGDRQKRLPNNVNFSFRFIEGESLLIMLDMKGICASSGSACTSGSLDPSHVLLAIGLPHEIAHGSLRLTLGADTTKEEIDYVVEELKEIVSQLRGMSPLYEDFVKIEGQKEQ